jgi:hypothetical protein
VIALLASVSSRTAEAQCNKMYWTDARSPSDIQRADLCGNNVETLYGPLFCTNPPCQGGDQSPIGLALDVPAGKIYWSDDASDSIYRGNMGGGGLPELLLSHVGGQVHGIAFDDTWLYWADTGFVCGSNSASRILRVPRARLSTPPLPVLASDPQIQTLDLPGIGPSELVVAGGFLYWGDHNGTCQSNASKICRVSLTTLPNPPLRRQLPRDEHRPSFWDRSDRKPDLLYRVQHDGTSDEQHRKSLACQSRWQ